jgi:2,7-dihydroxy-5-methyl-1-naphthoate 7-O-methyltransferase
MTDQVDLHQLSDLCTPWCVRVVATLRIAEHIDAGTTDVHDLAAATGADPRALRHVLTHLAGKGVFVEPEPGTFTLGETGRQLRDPRVRIGLDMDGIAGRFAHAWSTLPTYVRTGRSGYAERFGRPFWEDLDAHPDLAASFDDLIGPGGHGTPDAQIDLVDGWDAVRTVVDVGGGTGAMLAELLRTRPGLRGILVDLPRTVARAGDTLSAAGVVDRVRAVGQSFFDPLPAGADLYLLRSVLNDWPDEETEAILRRCAEAAPPSGRVVVIGGVVPDDAPQQLTIEMVLLGGRSTTVTEFRAIAHVAGLKIRAAGWQPSGSFVVECRPAA